MSSREAALGSSCFHAITQTSFACLELIFKEWFIHLFSRCSIFLHLAFSCLRLCVVMHHPSGLKEPRLKALILQDKMSLHSDVNKFFLLWLRCCHEFYTNPVAFETITFIFCFLGKWQGCWLLFIVIFSICTVFKLYLCAR